MGKYKRNHFDAQAYEDDCEARNESGIAWLPRWYFTDAGKRELESMRTCQSSPRVWESEQERREYFASLQPPRPDPAITPSHNFSADVFVGLRDAIVRFIEWWEFVEPTYLELSFLLLGVVTNHILSLATLVVIIINIINRSKRREKPQHKQEKNMLALATTGIQVKHWGDRLFLAKEILYFNDEDRPVLGEEIVVSKFDNEGNTFHPDGPFEVRHKNGNKGKVPYEWQPIAPKAKQPTEQMASLGELFEGYKERPQDDDLPGWADIMKVQVRQMMEAKGRELEYKKAQPGYSERVAEANRKFIDRERGTEHRSV